MVAKLKVVLEEEIRGKDKVDEFMREKEATLGEMSSAESSAKRKIDDASSLASAARTRIAEVVACPKPVILRSHRRITKTQGAVLELRGA